MLMLLILAMHTYMTYRRYAGGPVHIMDDVIFMLLHSHGSVTGASRGAVI